MKRPAPIKNADIIRVFFALWPEPAIQRQLHAIAEAYQVKCNARVMRADTLHLTLQFIGNIKRSQLPKLAAAADIAAAIMPFRLELDTLAFWKHNRIGYATLAAREPALETLAATLQRELADAGFTAGDGTGFSPHVTLFRNVGHMLAPQYFAPVAWQVNSLVLVESVMANHGAEYRTLHEWPFAA
ncbi:RNA 2',3'-cyclic phosphodiesterase [Methylotenera sp. G11]|uniref:RNA 2',3'-cyclic phosphodiesterase n=1 Tax=Methylotenera sp. G11 TaxID=1506585 RepID=UPI0006893FC2|nr:RNA 2',3'-cyclic phosphodiesterase [Methylotenera sp. G11]